MARLCTAICLVLLVANAAAQTIITGGCNAANVPGPVRKMVLVPNRYGDGMRVNWKAPAGANCIAYYEVKVVENGPTPRTLGGIPAQTQDYSVQVKRLRPGQEYLVTVRAVNNRGGGPAEEQLIIPVKATDCKRVPAAVKDLSANPIDHKTMTVTWTPADSCYEAAEVQVFEAVTNKKVHQASVADTVDKVPGLSPKTEYKVIVTPFGNGNKKGPSTQVNEKTPCNAVDRPGSANGLNAKSQPNGVIQLDIRGLSNNVCVAEWEVVARGDGKAPTFKVKPIDPLNSAAATFKFTGKAGKAYTFSVTAIGAGGVRGITSNIGPVIADGKTQLEVAPRPL